MDKEFGAARMVGADVFQAVQNPNVNTLGLVAIRDFLNNPAGSLRLVS
jgi:hypothetical protein